MLGVIAGYDPNDATSSREPVPDYTQALNRDIKGVRIGAIRELQSGLSDEVAHGFAVALRQLGALGADIDEVSIPSIEASSAAALNIIWSEALEYHEKWIRTRANDYGKGVRRMLEMAMTLPASSYIRAQRARTLILGETLRALDRCDVLATPTCGTPPPRCAEARASSSATSLAQVIRYTGPFNLTGQPAIAVPIGITQDNAPLSMQIVGRPFDEMAILRVADAYERARGPMPPASF
jgi:aspartyl-tRNA(Asn)/glutamyl-tRNA(Gln) amidotransferase subunit A